MGGLNKVTHAAASRRSEDTQTSARRRRLAHRPRAERKVLGNHGYDVEVAVDGMDGWNAVRMSDFDLVITDIDMPRMDGIEAREADQRRCAPEVAARDDRLVQGSR